MNATITDIGQTRLRQYHKNHPLRIRRGKDKGRLPHELENKLRWEKWMILQGMTEDCYWRNVLKGEGFATRDTKDFKRLPTAKLNPDQRGWAKHDHPQHFEANGFWLINPAKPSRPFPDEVFEIKRDLIYPAEGCGHEADFKMFGKTHNGKVLVRCTECRKISVGG
jgi:hypothetical protein